ncbi:MAG: hypothetical protein ACOZBH_03425 [Patescibacteria group bacterium]
MTSKITNKMADKVFASSFGAWINFDVASQYKISSKKLVDFADIINSIMLKKIKLENLDKELTKRLRLPAQKSKLIAKEITGRKFLLIDDYFGGAASKYLTVLGARPENYKDQIELLKSKLHEEDALVAEKETPFEGFITPAEKKESGSLPPIEIKDQEKDAREIASIFDEQVMGIINDGDFRLKGDLNAYIVLLLLEKEDFRQTLLQKMVNNREKVTAKEIVIGGQPSEPNVSNWLKDFISIVGVDGSVSSINKARYMSESKNVRSLSADEQRRLDMVLDVYTSIRNFPQDATRMNLGDIAIFPFSDEDIKAMKAAAESVKTKPATPRQLPKDIFELYMGSKEEQAKIEAAKEALENKISGNVKLLADELEDGFLKKEKQKTIAALMLLVEKGAFINLLREDIRYRDYLTSYLNRVGKATLVNSFVVNPTQPQFVIYLLKYILEERLSLSVSEAARIAAHFNTIYTKRGQEQYGRLAYFDMNEQTFVWGQ